MRTGIMAVLAGVLVAPATAGAAATSPEFFGTNLGTLGSLSASGQGVALGELGRGRMAVNRIEVRWSQVEPTGDRNGNPAAGYRPVYRWAATENAIRSMAQHGLRASPMFRFTPGWAASGGDELPAESHDDFGRFIAEFARKFGVGGSFWAENPSLVPRPTLTYELWNEANLNEYAWNADADADAYAAVAKAVRPIIKAAQPGAIILSSLSWKDELDEAGGSTEGPGGIEPHFVSKLAANGGLDAFDGMGFHPYAPDAQSTLDLVMRLRWQLNAVGRPDMPIYADEAGQEAIINDPLTGRALPGDRVPADDAHDLFPSDGARAANLAFAGEALAASDCKVKQFLPYSVSSSYPASSTSTNASEPRTEAWMGLFYPTTGQPTRTAQALQRAAQRWAARFDAGGPGAPASLPICGGGPIPAASMLPIDGAFTGQGPGCASVVTTYDGNPLESAYLRFIDPSTGAELAQARTNAFGYAIQCIPVTLRGRPFRIYANIGVSGMTGIVDCDILGRGCMPGATISPGRGVVSALAVSGLVPAPPPPPPPPATPKACEWDLKVKAGTFTKDKRGTRGRQRATVSVTCHTATPGSKVRFVVIRKKHKSKREQKVTTVMLTVGKPRVVGVSGVRRGERIVFLHRAEPTIGIPRLRRSAAVDAKPVKKSVKKSAKKSGSSTSGRKS